MNLADKIRRFDRLEDLAYDWKRDQIAPVVREVLVAMGKIKPEYNGGLTSFHRYKDGETTVRYCGSCRGCDWSDDFEIPNDIMTSAMPVEAAKAWKRAEDMQKAIEAEKRRVKMINDLEQQLANLKG